MKRNKTSAGPARVQFKSSATPIQEGPRWGDANARDQRRLNSRLDVRMVSSRFANVLRVAFITSVCCGVSFANEPAECNVMGYWSLNEDSGLTAHDSSGNANDGTLTSDTIWGGPGYAGTGSYIVAPEKAAYAATS